MSNSIRPAPCNYCPYRKDVPSGVWHAAHYEGLRDYDRPTTDQPMVEMGCHEQNGMLCAGWAQCHSNRGRAFDLLALRIWPEEKRVPKITVPIFKSGTEAAEHGLRDIDMPGIAALKVMRYIKRLHAKLKQVRRKSKSK